MSRKKLLKKWGAYALGVMALTGGMVATNVISDNAVQVNAQAQDFQLAILKYSSDAEYYATDGFVGVTDDGTWHVNAFTLHFNTKISSESVNIYTDSHFKINVDNVDFDNLVFGEDITYLNGTGTTSKSSRNRMDNYITFYSLEHKIGDFLF